MLDEIRVESDGLVDDLIREVTIMEEDIALGLPAMKVEVAYLTRDTYRKLMKPFLGKKDPTPADEEKYRASVAEKCWRGWKGMTLRNLSRVSEYVLLNFSALKDAFEKNGVGPDDEIAWDIKDAAWVARRINGEHFAAVQEEIQNMEKFALELQENQKNF